MIFMDLGNLNGIVIIVTLSDSKQQETVDQLRRAKIHNLGLGDANGLGMI